VLLDAQLSKIRSPSKLSDASEAKVNGLSPKTSSLLNCTFCNWMYKLVLSLVNSFIATGRGTRVPDSAERKIVESSAKAGIFSASFMFAIMPKVSTPLTEPALKPWSFM
jgi:hypothetical protein